MSAGTRVPDFFIVGHEKCGTTALFNILRQHPQVFMPDLKEPRFFFRDRPRSDATKEWIGAGADLRPGTLDAYLSLFADAGPEQRAGEASPQYIRSPDAARLIAQVQPGARIIALLREPTSLVQNFHLNNLLTWSRTSATCARRSRSKGSGGKACRFHPDRALRTGFSTAITCVMASSCGACSHTSRLSRSW